MATPYTLAGGTSTCSDDPRTKDDSSRRLADAPASRLCIGAGSPPALLVAYRSPRPHLEPREPPVVYAIFTTVFDATIQSGPVGDPSLRRRSHVAESDQSA